MKTILLSLLVLFTVQSFGQEPCSDPTNRMLDTRAEKLAVEYHKELYLSCPQIGLFETKIEEFIFKRDRIEDSLIGRPRLEAMYKLCIQETTEMQYILTHNQLKTYAKVKSGLQPLNIRY